MYNLFSMSILLLVFLLQSHKAPSLPAEFYQIPEEIRDKATVIVTGRYGHGRTPCFFRPDGTRVWGLDSWFDVKKVYQGKIGNKFIRINSGMLPETPYAKVKLERDGEYLVLLRPSEEKLKRLSAREEIGFFDALRNEEIVAIVKLKL